MPTPQLDIEKAQKEKEWVALSSVIAAIFLTLMKLIVGFITNSLGIISEGLHSGLDLLAAAITLFAVRSAAKPPDEKHHYGHGKVESFSAFAEVIILFITCAWIIWEALKRLTSEYPPEIDATWYAFTVIIISILIDTSRSRALSRTAKKYSSEALEADALHFSSDVFSSIIVIVGLIFVRIEFPEGDAIAAIGVAILVIIASFRLGKRTFDVLVDRAPPGLSEKINEVVKTVEGVRDCKRIRVRRAGPDIFVDMEIFVPRAKTFEKAHVISQRVENAVKNIVPNADVFIHINPMVEDEEELAHKIKAIASKMRGIKEVHNISIRKIEKKLHIDFHLKMDGKLKLKEGHKIAHALEKSVKKDIRNVKSVTTHIESIEEEGIVSDDITWKSADFIKKIEALVYQDYRIKNCHSIAIERSEGKILISMHCATDENTPIEKAHELCNEIEKKIERYFPNSEITIHIEPCGTVCALCKEA